MKNYTKNVNALLTWNYFLLVIFNNNKYGMGVITQHKNMFKGERSMSMDQSNFLFFFVNWLV